MDQRKLLKNDMEIFFFLKTLLVLQFRHNFIYIFPHTVLCKSPRQLSFFLKNVVADVYLVTSAELDDYSVVLYYIIINNTIIYYYKKRSNERVKVSRRTVRDSATHLLIELHKS